MVAAVVGGSAHITTSGAALKAGVALRDVIVVGGTVLGIMSRGEVTSFESTDFIFEVDEVLGGAGCGGHGAAATARIRG